MDSEGRYIPKLKKARRLLGLSQKRAAKKLRVDAADLSRWENGAAYPNIENLLKLSGLYKTSVEELYPRLYRKMCQFLDEQK
jgi:transcriptional regulator with XRE-family HTH domain